MAQGARVPTSLAVAPARESQHPRMVRTAAKQFVLLRPATVTCYQARIYVTLRPSVLDPAGTAVETGLHHLGYSSVEGVRIGKYVELKLVAESEGQARQQLDLMCDQLLANPVIENYRFELDPIA